MNIVRKIVAIAFLGVLSAHAQIYNCGSTPILTDEYLSFENQIDQIVQQKSFDKASEDEPKIIPVVVHIIHHDDTGNISDEQVENAIEILNAGYRGDLADYDEIDPLFHDFVVDVSIEFRLATVDPDGNPTNGIVRVNSPKTFKAADNVKALSKWPTTKYYNIWVASTVGAGEKLSGYSPFPGTDWDNFGIVMRHDHFGDIGTSVTDGTTTIHESGHSFDLFHTFEKAFGATGSGCGGKCHTKGDKVCDTPPAMEAYYDCNKSLNSCANDTNGDESPYQQNAVDQVQNFMSYHSCRAMFTQGQKDRINAAFKTHVNLSRLTKENNLIATGVSNSQITNIDANQSTDLNVFYNNTLKQININALTKSTVSIKVYDLYGRLIEARENLSIPQQVDISDYIRGYYLIMLYKDIHPLHTMPFEVY